MAGFDIIKQYLISIGFNLDENSMSNAENKMNLADKKIRDSQKQNQQEFNNSSNVLKGLFELISASPQMRNFIPSSIRGDLTDILKKINQINNLDLNNVLSKLFPPKSDTEPNETLERIKNGISKFTDQGSKDMLKFSGTSIMAFTSIAIALKGYVSLIEWTISLLKDLSEKDIGYEKLSRQLWITKENAREVNKALDTMGVSLEDLWLSPTLLKQFNQLRQDSKDLKLPDDYNKNLKIVQQISTEFARTKQMGSIAFEWVGNSIMKNCRGPLEEIMGMMHQGNTWLKDKLPGLADSAGNYIGNVIKPLADGIYVAFKLGEKAKNLYDEIKNKIGGNDTAKKVFDDINKGIRFIKNNFINLTMPFVKPFKLAILTVEDLALYFRTGKSPMMDFFSGIGDKLSDCKERINNIKEDVSNWYDDSSFKKSIDNIEEWINSGLDKINEYIDKIKEKLSIKLPSLKLNSNSKENDSNSDNNSNGWSLNLGEIGKEIKKAFSDSMLLASPGLYTAKKSYDAYQSYQGYSNSNTTNNTKQDNSKTNSDNKIINHNSFTVNGNDAQSNARAIGTTMNSILTRSLG
jgi:hypothetical protein|nr:MAG TPA: hypothetical protein [Caudoviricetes sp.]